MNAFRGLRLSACRSLGVLFVLGSLGWCESAQGDPVAPVEVVISTVAVPELFHDPLAVKSLKVLSGFGKRALPPTLLAAATSQAEIKFYEKAHEGVDYAGVAGMSVLAARDGKVLFSGFSKSYASRKNKNDQTRLVILSHSDGLSTRYVHLATLRVRPQQEVTAGQVIGTLAESDEWTQPVLHFEIRDKRGQALDPVRIMAEAAKTMEMSVTP